MTDEHTSASEKSANFIESFGYGISEVNIKFKDGFVDFECNLGLNTELKCHASSQKEFMDIIDGIISSAKKHGFANNYVGEIK